MPVAGTGNCDSFVLVRVLQKDASFRPITTLTRIILFVKLNYAVTEFLKAQAGTRAPATRRWYAKRLKNLEPLYDKILSRVSATDLRRIWAELCDRQERWVEHPTRPTEPKGLAPYTLHGYVRAWRGFFNWCVRQKYITTSPAALLAKPSLPDMPPKAISKNDMEKMVQVADDSGSPRDYAIVCLLADTACRVCGLAGLKLDDLDLRRGRATVREKGRGGKGKSRTIYLQPRTVQAVRDYLSQRPVADCNAVFLNPCHKPLTEAGIYLMLKRLARASKVKGRWNPHAWRHGWARGALDNGAALNDVATFLGHSNISVTAKFYARWADDELQRKHAQVSWLPPQGMPTPTATEDS